MGWSQEFARQPNPCGAGLNFSEVTSSVSTSTADCVGLCDGLGAWHFQFHGGIGDERSRPEPDAENAAESEI